MRQDSVVSIETCYRLDSPEDQTPVAVKFSTPVQTSSGAHLVSYTMDTVSFPGVKQWGNVLTTHFHLELRLKTEYSYTFLPSVLSWQVIG
jgi:hypothetical protein